MSNIAEKYGEYLNFDGKVTYNTIGCEKCNNTGYYDRIAIFEILPINDEIKELIMNGASSIEIRRQALKGSYRPLVIDGLHKVLEGSTTLEELNNKLVIF